MMSGYKYLAWDMLVTAAYEDERREQGYFRATMRKAIRDPLKHISANNFIKEYGLNKEAFEDLCEILRHYTDLKSTQRVSMESKVLCALNFYTHGSYQRNTGKANNFSQEAMSIYIEEITTALNHPNILNKFIKFPKTRQERDTIKQGFFNKYGIPGTIGCVDASHFKIFTPPKETKHLYFCRNNYHSINVQMVCDHNSSILSVNAKFGGATDDSFIWENSIINDYMQSLHRHNEIVWLLGDSGYEQMPWLMTPYLNPAHNSIEETFNAVHTTARVVIENTFGLLKNRWRCVHRDKPLHYKPEKCSRIIIACCVLHNLALKYKIPKPEEMIVSEEPQEPFEQHEVVLENENYSATDLVRGRALRDQLARRLYKANINS